MICALMPEYDGLELSSQVQHLIGKDFKGGTFNQGICEGKDESDCFVELIL